MPSHRKDKTRLREENIKEIFLIEQEEESPGDEESTKSEN